MARKPLKKTGKQVYNLPANNYLSKIESELKSNQSKLSLVLGALIVLVVGILIFNYFNKGKPDLGPAQQTETTEQLDVAVGELPGKYTVKEGDTLYLIAEKYYKDGFRFEEIAKANNLVDVNTIEVGQVLEIPKLTDTVAMVSPEPSPTPQSAMSPSPSPQTPTVAQNSQADLGMGGGDTTIWGSKIEGKTYTVVEGDWLSTISARAYGDIYAYNKLAEASNIPDPDYIVPGQVITIPR